MFSAKIPSRSRFEQDRRNGGSQSRGESYFLFSMWNGDDPGAVHFDGKRALHESHREHKAALPFEAQHNSFQPAEGAGFNSNPLTDLQERPRPAWESGPNGSLNRAHFAIVYRNRSPAHPDDPKYTRGLKNRKPVVQVDPAKHITGEERENSFPDPV